VIPARTGKVRQCFGFLLLALFLLIEDAQKENPGQLGHILHRAGTVPTPHNVADALDCLIYRLLSDKSPAISISVPSLCHLSLADHKYRA
jgi:hypothetical protein